jgi:hypothetical protein
MLVLQYHEPSEHPGKNSTLRAFYLGLEQGIAASASLTGIEKRQKTRRKMNENK